MSEGKFPPRIVALRESIKEPHDPIDAIVLDPDGLLHPIHDVVYVSLSEHAAIVAELERKLGVATKGLQEVVCRCNDAPIVGGYRLAMVEVIAVARATLKEIEGE